MRRIVFTVLISLVWGSSAASQSPSDLAPAEGSQLKLGTIVGYNFNGDQSWANLQPEVFVGFDAGIGGNWRLKIGPTISSGGNTTDSTSFFRSLMLPGNVGVSSLLYWQTSEADEAKTTAYAALGLGLKAVTGKVDTTTENVAQHNIRLAGGIRFKKSLVLASQYTIGWHNLTNESEVSFKRAFHANATRVEYLMISLQTYLPGQQMFLDLTWRAMTNPGQFPDFRDKNRIIGIGLRKDIDLLVAPAAVSK